MRYRCEFQHRDTGECKTIVASLSLAECESIERVREREGSENAEVRAQACALRQAYAELPEGFLHTEPPTLQHVS